MKQKFILPITLILLLFLFGCVQNQQAPELGGVKYADKNPLAPAETDYAQYDSTENGFKINYPKKWEATYNEEPNVTLFTSPLEGSKDSFKESVNISLVYLGDEKVSLDKFTSDQIDELVRRVNRMELVDAKKVAFGGVAGNDMVYVGEVDGDFMQIRQVWGIDEGNYAYILTYAAQKDSFNRYANTVEQMIKSFAIYVPAES